MDQGVLVGVAVESRPARGGWIEIGSCLSSRGSPAESRPARGGWIEMSRLWQLLKYFMSRPARGGWIEIHTTGSPEDSQPVPPRKGRVD